MNEFEIDLDQLMGEGVPEPQKKRMRWEIENLFIRGNYRDVLKYITF